MRPLLSKSAVVGVALAAANLTTAAGPQASAPPPQVQTQPALTLHTNANLVLLDVVVTAHGNIIRGLNQSQFQLLENGKPQTITSFEEHIPKSVPAESSESRQQKALPPGIYTNLPAYPPSTAVNVLLLDALNTPIADQMRVRSEMIDYLKTIPPGTHMAIFTLTSRLRMVEGFTTDASLLSKAIRDSKNGPQPSVVLDPQSNSMLASTTAGLISTGGGNTSGSGVTGAPMDAVAAMQQFQADVTAFQTDQRVGITLDAMQQLARYLMAIPGRKNLIWFSGSFPISIDPDDSLADPFQSSRNYSQDLQETGRLLSAARVAVYPVDARGLMTDAIYDASYTSPSNLMAGTNMSGSGKRGSGRIRGSGNLGSTISKANSDALKQMLAEQASMQQFAGDTGGRAFLNSNDLKGAIAQVLEDGSSYYTLAYVPNTNALDGRFHKLQVKVSGGNYKLEYRPGYYAEDSSQAKPHPATMVGTASMMVAAAVRGAPASTEIIFKTKLEPEADLPSSNLAVFKPAGEMAASLKGPIRRYKADLGIQAKDLAFVSTPDGNSQAHLEFTLVAFDSDGKRINYVDAGRALTLKPSQYQIALHTGLPARQEIDLPLGQAFIRIAVHDLISDRVGSLEVPVTVSNPPHN